LRQHDLKLLIDGIIGKPISDYRIARKLGGMDVVYKGRDAKLGR
jgi:hypothetical protein